MYATFKTTMGRKYRVKLSRSEAAERRLFHIALVVVPFVTSALMFWIWVKIGG